MTARRSKIHRGRRDRHGRSCLPRAIDDPAGQPLERAREIRDEIERRVRDLIENRADEIRSDRSGHDRRLAQLLPSLDDDFGASKSGEEIRACADAILNDYDDAPVRSFVLTLAERRIRDCLREPTAQHSHKRRHLRSDVLVFGDELAGSEGRALRVAEHGRPHERTIEGWDDDLAAQLRMVLTRKGVSRTVGGRTASTNRIALGADTDGRLAAIVHTSVTRVGRIGGWLEQTTAPTRSLYGAANLLTQQNVVELDLLPNSWLRAPGEAIGVFALESAMDELAVKLAIDPIELRMRNEPDAEPLKGKRFSQRMLREAFALGAERFGWSERTPEPGSMRDGRWLVGMGVATAFHTALRVTANVAVRLAADGSVLVQCAFHELGVGAATVQGQIAADALGVPFEAVRVEYGDSNLPAGPMAGQSTQTASVATSVLAACDELNQKLRALARRTGTVGESHATTLAAAGLPSIEATVGSGTRLGKLTGQARFLSRYLRDQRWSKAARGAQFCEVRVDTDTGEVRISRWLGVFDVGRVINPKTAASQLRGSVVMGIGMALSEQSLIDPRNGRTMSAGLDSYYVPVHADIPPIDVTWLDEPDKTMPMGILGLGEVGMTGVAPAIANAVFHATGKRIRDLPITLDKLV
jgi:xanthine dehydrogenase YagR molybdenum-binding subunit